MPIHWVAVPGYEQSGSSEVSLEPDKVQLPPPAYPTNETVEDSHAPLGFELKVQVAPPAPYPMRASPARDATFPSAMTVRQAPDEEYDNSFGLSKSLDLLTASCLT